MFTELLHGDEGETRNEVFEADSEQFTGIGTKMKHAQYGRNVIQTWGGDVTLGIMVSGLALSESGGTLFYVLPSGKNICNKCLCARV